MQTSVSFSAALLQLSRPWRPDNRKHLMINVVFLEFLGIKIEKNVYIVNRFVIQVLILWCVCFRSWYQDSKREKADLRCPSHQVLGGGQETHLYWQCQHGLEVPHTGTLCFYPICEFSYQLEKWSRGIICWTYNERLSDAWSKAKWCVFCFKKKFL